MTTDPKRALIIEDSDLQAKLCALIFERHSGWETVRAKDGVDGLDKLVWEREFRERDFDLIMLDLNMPRMDGISFLDAVNKRGFGHIPVIIVSTEDKDTEIKTALRAGARAYVKKPWQPEQVWTLIQKIFPDLA